MGPISCSGSFDLDGIELTNSAILAGKGLADLFMRPYNFKVWAVPTTEVNQMFCLSPSFFESPKADILLPPYADAM